jgi:hypothetical protein
VMTSNMLPPNNSCALIKCYPDSCLGYMGCLRSCTFLSREGCFRSLETNEAYPIEIVLCWQLIDYASVVK